MALAINADAINIALHSIELSISQLKVIFQTCYIEIKSQIKNFVS